MTVSRNVVEAHQGRLGIYCQLVQEHSHDGAFSPDEPHKRHLIGGEFVRKSWAEVRKDVRDNNATLREI